MVDRSPLDEPVVVGGVVEEPDQSGDGMHQPITFFAIFVDREGHQNLSLSALNEVIFEDIDHLVKEQFLVTGEGEMDGFHPLHQLIPVLDGGGGLGALAGSLSSTGVGGGVCRGNITHEQAKRQNNAK